MDIGNNKFFCVTQATVSRCLHEVTDALNNPQVFNRFVKFPSTIAELNNLRTSFYHQYQFPGIIGVIDCTHVAITPPNGYDEQHPEHAYVNRKHYHSINVQLICDNKLKILNVNAMYPGSTHDAYVWNNSQVQEEIRRLHARGHRGYYLLGDSGYPLRPWLMTPLNNPPLHDTPEYHYQSKFKTIRCTIERCNGVLKKPFRCLLKDRALNYSPGFAGRIINACVVLHNLCIDHNIPEVIDDDLPRNPDFGMYYHKVGCDNENLVNAARINPELAEGRRVRARIIRTLN